MGSARKGAQVPPELSPWSTANAARNTNAAAPAGNAAEQVGADVLVTPGRHAGSGGRGRTAPESPAERAAFRRGALAERASAATRREILENRNLGADASIDEDDEYANGTIYDVEDGEV